jgi:hypothetical protein
MQDQEPSAPSGDAKPVYCPRCGKLAPILPDHEDLATILNEDGELVPDYGIFNGPVRDLFDWVLVGPFLVCSDCATVEEIRAPMGDCIRCGREDDEAWWASAICNHCATRDEEREGVLRYLHVVAETIAITRASEDFERAEAAGLPGSWAEVVKIMAERGVPNHLHYLDPIDVFADPDDGQPCWDTVSSGLQHAILRCDELLLTARYAIPEDLPVGGGWPMNEAPGWSQKVDWWLVERTIRRYVREARGAGRARVMAAPLVKTKTPGIYKRGS